jgi:hypothetical protein
MCKGAATLNVCAAELAHRTFVYSVRPCSAVNLQQPIRRLRTALKLQMTCPTSFCARFWAARHAWAEAGEIMSSASCHDHTGSELVTELVNVRMKGSYSRVGPMGPVRGSERNDSTATPRC